MPTRGDANFQGWPAGINNVAKETSLPDGALRDALNVDLDSAGKPRRRDGRTKVLEGVRTHSLYNASCGPVFVEGTELRRLLPDHTFAALGDLSGSSRVSYTTVNAETYLTNGFDVWKLTSNGVLSLSGVPSPNGQPTPSYSGTAGVLQPGRYLFAVTFVDSSGEESGASLAIEVTLSQSGAVILSSIPQNSGASHVRIYGTETNGSVLREFARIPMGVTSYQITQPVMGRVLSTQFYRRMPAGNIIRHFKGQMYVADGKTLWRSKAMQFGLNNPSDGFYQYPEDITVVEPVENGIFVVADQTYFIAGENPGDVRQLVVSQDKGIPGTGDTFQGSLFDDGLSGEVAYWYSPRGAMLGLPGGSVRPLMEQTVALPEYEEGATMMREQNGIRQAVTALRGSGSSAKFALGDEISVTVKRNGIVL